MTISKFIIFFYRASCAGLCVFLLLGILGMLGKLRYYDAAFGSVSFSVTAYLFNKPSIKHFMIIAGVFAITCFLVGTYDNVGV